MIDFNASRHLPVSLVERGIQAGDWLLAESERLDCGPAIGELAAGELRAALEEYATRTRGGYRPQLAALVFFATGRPRALDHYFRLLKSLDEAQVADFYRLAGVIAESPNLDLRLIDVGGAPIDIPADAAYLVAGQIAELLFFRRDILDRLLAAPRRIWLYAAPRAYAEDGGVAGGCYNSTRGCVQLLLARLYEGFFTPTPGGAPFVHEFGHMLDHFDAASATQGASSGLLPGLRAADGAIYTPAARELFVKGKRLELERYLRLQAGAPPESDALPIGHPYVFQNDTEFIAGYLEMFFRNPHYFARQNPHLYGGLATLLRQDPRRAWETDFPVYVADNRGFYLSGQRPGQTRVTLPAG